jgi:hypothetical protein
MNKVDYVICIPGENFSSNFLISWSNSLIELMKKSENFIFINHYTSIVSYTRNQLIRSFPGEKSNSKNVLPFDGRLEAKKIVFIDDDIVWNFEDLNKILKSKEDIVSGFYKMKFLNNENNNQLAAIKNNNFLISKDIENQTDLIELDGVGFGFIAINFEVFKKIKFPWFQTYDFFNEKDECVVNVGEDFDFCKKAINAGYKIYGDPMIKVGHEKTKILDFKND